MSTSELFVQYSGLLMKAVWSILIEVLYCLNPSAEIGDELLKEIALSRIPVKFLAQSYANIFDP